MIDNSSPEAIRILADNSARTTYNIESLPLYIARETLSGSTGMSTAPHWNEDLEVVYIREGQMSIVVNGEATIAKEGEIVIIDAKCIHYFTSIDNQDCTYFIGLLNETLFSAAEPIREKYINPIFHAYHPNIDVIAADSKNHKEIGRTFAQIGQLIMEKKPAYDIKVVALLHELLALLWDTLEDSYFLPVPVNSQDADVFRNIIMYIQKNYSKKILVADMADAVGISRKQCFALFARFMGKTPGDFLIEYRLETGRSMLRNTSLSIADIAAACGFSHQSHFTNHFRSSFDMTPNAYRKFHRKD